MRFGVQLIGHSDIMSDVDVLTSLADDKLDAFQGHRESDWTFETQSAEEHNRFLDEEHQIPVGWLMVRASCEARKDTEEGEEHMA